MPNRINVGTEQSPKWKELGTLNCAVNNPMERFRSEAGLSSWTKRKNTLVIKEGLRKLYVNVLQNNSFKAFGRDITRKELKELKKGEEAIFPVAFRHWTAQECRSNGAAEPARPKDNTEVEKALLKKRKHAAADEGQASEEEAQSPLRSRKRGCQCSEESSIAAEVDDLPEAVLSIDEPSDESSADEEYENDPTQQNSSRRTRRPAATRHGERIERSSEEDSAETEIEEIPDHRSASERIPETGDFGGKSKEPFCTSSTDDPSKRNQGKENRRMEVLGKRGQSAHYARYQDLSSNEPAYHAGISDAPLQNEFQTPEINSTFLEHNGPSSSQSHASEAIMNGPFEWKYPEGDFAALQAHRKWRVSFYKDKDALKRLRTGQPVLPLPAAATN